MLGRLMPREGHFFDLFNAHAERISEGSRSLAAMMADFSQAEVHAQHIDGAERAAEHALHLRVVPEEERRLEGPIALVHRPDHLDVGLAELRLAGGDAPGQLRSGLGLVGIRPLVLLRNHLELAGRGVFRGRERVREYLHHLPPYGHGMLYNHMQLQPVIHVDSEAGTAKGRWRSFMMVGALVAEARWGEATYENEYVRIDGEWRIALLHGYMNIYVEFDQGWNKGGVKLLRSIEGLQPDEPPTLRYETFPAPFVAPFHYDKV